MVFEYHHSALFSRASLYVQVYIHTLKQQMPKIEDEPVIKYVPPAFAHHYSLNSFLFVGI